MDIHDPDQAAHPPSSDFRQRPAHAIAEDYRSLIGDEALDSLLNKANALRDLHIVNISSTYYGGGVAQLLSSLTLLMNAAGIRTGWRIIQGRPTSSASPRRCTMRCRVRT
jgi:hypothetical protein